MYCLYRHFEHIRTSCVACSSVAVLCSEHEGLSRVSPADWSCPGLGWSYRRPATEPVRRRGRSRSRSNAAGGASTRRTSLSRYDDAVLLQTPGGRESALSVCFTSSFVQVEEGSAKPGRDFTHSTAGLVQFDPGGTRFIRHTHGDGHERLPASVIRPFCFTKLKSKVPNVQLQVPESTAVRNNQSDSAAVQPMAGRS